MRKIAQGHSTAMCSLSAPPDDNGFAKEKQTPRLKINFKTRLQQKAFFNVVAHNFGSRENIKISTLMGARPYETTTVLWHRAFFEVNFESG